MRFICINDCDNSDIKLYKNDKTFLYEKGKIYDYKYNQYYVKNSICLISDDVFLYRGIVDNDFIKHNFIAEIDIMDIIDEVNDIFKNILI
jgi:hypothetical protein